MSVDPAAIPGQLQLDLLTYDTAIDWPARLAREAPLLRRALEAAPSRRVLDLGSGTGEHARWLAGEGCTVVGIEGVEERWEAARRDAPPEVQFLLGDLGAVEAMVRGHFGTALCLGDTLPALLGVEALSRMFVGLRRRLLPGGPFVAHQLGYDRLVGQGTAELPERRLEDAAGELVFRRELEMRDDGVVGVTDTVLRRPREGQEELLRRRTRFHQGWRHEELLTLLDVAGFRRVESFAGFAGEPFDPAASAELVLVAS